MNLQVLIVDDSATGRKMLRKSLPPSLQADITEAGSGEEALRVCAARPLDLMFLDLTMPGVTGFDVLDELQKQTTRPVTVVVSGDVQLRAQERVMALGAFAFIQKPVRAADLDTVLRGARFL